MTENKHVETLCLIIIIYVVEYEICCADRLQINLQIV